MRMWWNRLNEEERELLRELVGKTWYDTSAFDVVRKLLKKIKEGRA